jgi:poly-gamma-glutamate capsule biosynthesis protein CapA/YwtB (metallophosphatase superfamily)
MVPRAGHGGDAGRRRRARARRRRLPLVAAVISMVVGLVALAVAWVADSEPPPPPQPVATDSPSPTPAGPRQVTVLGAGDVLIHPPVWEQARADADGDGFDFYPIFAALTDAISAADLAICHLETPLAPPEGPFHGWPQFSAPPQLVPALVEVGYDACSTASNHTLDRGEEGVYRTIDALEEAGLAWAGSARSAEEAATPTVLEVTTADGRTVSVGQLSYTFGFNGLLRPEGKEWIANLIDVDQILEEAATARAAGAEIVILSMHWGEEYVVEPTASQLEQAEVLIASDDIDLIFGHHVHVVQPVERFDDGWVVYGMGNQIARHAQPIDAQREGAMVTATFVEQDGGWTVTEIEAIPTWVDLEPQIRLVNLSDALADPDLSEQQRGRYQEAYERIVTSLHSRGADADGLVVR